MKNLIENGNYCVYVHTSPSGKMYVGQTCKKPEQRWRNGAGYLYKHKNKDGYKQPAFAHAILKYGWDNFEHEIIASNLTKDEADNFEKLLIEKLNTMNPEFGYNCVGGGNSGSFSEEVRKKISEANKGEKHPLYGKHHTEETKRKISESRKGLKISDETRKKLSEAKIGEKNYMYGKHHTEETRKKISENQKNKRKGAESPIAKKIAQYDLQGNLVKVWGCISDAGKELKVDISGIAKCCKGIYRNAGGFIWKYYEDELTKEDIILRDKTARERCVVQYSLSGEFICIYNSIKEASLKTNIYYSGISRCCMGTRKSAGGYIWKYHNNKDVEMAV